MPRHKNAARRALAAQKMNPGADDAYFFAARRYASTFSACWSV